jgi:dihydroneopterin aldolase
MFERFTERSRKVVVLAQEESGRLRHGHVGTEHLLPGLIREDEGVAAQALTASGVTVDGVREQAEIIAGYGEADTSQKPFRAESKKVLESSLKESMRLGHNYIGTEHLLLGLLRESEGDAARVLLNLDVDQDAVRREVIERLPDAGDDLDPFDEAEQEMEELEHRTLFRGRVGAIRAEVSLSRPLAVAADADYAYRARAESPPGSTTVEPGDIADLMRAGLQETDARGPETVIAALGERLLDAFPAMLEVNVTLAGSPEPEDPPGPTFSVSATFRR